MNQEKFENYGRALLFAIGAFVVIYFMFIITAKTYAVFQEDELRKLEKEYRELRNTSTKKEIEKTEREIELLNSES